MIFSALSFSDSSLPLIPFQGSYPDRFGENAFGIIET